jgi:molecular chaperone GrpE
MLRIAAEFENFKKRTRREQADAEAKSKEGVLRDMLEIVDNLERAVAFAESTDPKALLQGVQLVLRLFQNKLERYDVKPVDAKGLPFDPRIHDAISQVPTADAPPGSVVNEVQRGYRIGDRLLRPAMVSVAVALPADAGASQGSGDKA